MLFENCVANLVPCTVHCSPANASSARSRSTAVHASPKMKWKSRSSKLLWPDVISGLATSTHEAEPLRSASTAAWIEKVADEHATFMSYAQPPAPSSFWISIATAGYARCRFEHPTITASTSAPVRPAWASASLIAGMAISACSPS